ncbi:trypsin-like serine protease [Aspergillus germanicus]
MKHLLALFSALAAAAQLKPTIVGGTEVSIEDYSYHIALIRNGKLDCGGSIISPNHVVTAAHCVFDHPVSKFSIRAGSSSSKYGGVVVNVSSSSVHPKYDKVTLGNDIAILTLAKCLTFGPEIGPVDLPANEARTLVNGAEVVVSGWGSVQEGRPDSPTLQAVTVNVVNVDECRANYSDIGAITESIFCAGTWEGGKDACHGDSGGPVVATGSWLALSRGYGCAMKGYPGVYSNTAYLWSFIAQMTGL